ncbi:universal stress protein PHOS32-like [Zingiber officinale]|uniref:universal stress protein PHOS32-like n=1 Tax=Zingiber officinale TaxID=94328 RepID=UPI001C4CD88C|nr:universal stress protein PHOS32-like [Zingiber officinale]
MNPQKIRQETDRQVPPASAAAEAVAAAIAQAAIQPCSPRFFFSSAAAANPSVGSYRRIAIPVDLSDESAYAVKWAVQNYLRPGDAVILLHVCTTSVLYGADWGAIDVSVVADAAAARGDGAGSEESKRRLEENLEAFTIAKAQEIAKPLVEAQIPYKIHIVKDHDMKERLCLEVERLGLSAVIMGSRGFGAARRSDKGGLGSFSDYCVHHCICPVVVVRYPDEEAGVSTAIDNEAPPEIAAKFLKLNQSAEEDKLSDSPSKHKEWRE